MAVEQPAIVGPDVLVPGSEQVLGGLGRILAILGAAALLVTFLVRRRRAAPRRRPVGMAIAGAVTALGVVLAAVWWPPRFYAPEFPPLPPLFPEASLFGRTVTDLPAAPQSDRWIASQGALQLGSGFTSQVVEGVLWGNPFNLVDGSTPRKDVDIRVWKGGSHRGPYPISDPAYIEGMPTYGFDMHYLAVDLQTREAWELIAARAWFGKWEADSGAYWKMDSLDYPDGSTIAAGLPMLPGTVTYAEVAAGEVAHVLLGATPISSPEWIWPARGSDGRSTDPGAPPMGAWMRLKPDVDLSGLGPQARVIAEALQRYGLILSDTGPGFGLRGTPDARWDPEDLRTLSRITTDDFEFVDTSSIVVDPGSMEVTPPRG